MKYHISRLLNQSKLRPIFNGCHSEAHAEESHEDSVASGFFALLRMTIWKSFCRVASLAAIILLLFEGTGISGRPVISSVVSNAEQVVIAVR